jgi:hypothetical protein
MLTWNGEWSSDDSELATILVNEKHLDIDVVAAAVARNAYVCQVLQDLFDGFVNAAVTLGAEGILVAAEICPDAQTGFRLHFHAYVHAAYRYLQMFGQEHVCFCGGVPPSQTNKTDCIRRAVVRIRDQEGHYYLQYPMLDSGSGHTNFPALQVSSPSIDGSCRSIRPAK